MAPKELLPTVLLLVMFPIAAPAQFNYITNEGGTITITGYTGPGGAVTIPGTIDGLPVTEIDSAFIGSAALTSVIIPDTVTWIGGYAFAWCGNLVKVTLSTNLIFI